jgi:hypothetical protein
MYTHIDATIHTGSSIIIDIDEKIISNDLFTILPHAVMDTADSSIIGIPHSQVSHIEFNGIYLDIFGYIRGIQYIFDRVKIFQIPE